MRSIDELKDMTGRVALVTGGTGHIALAAEEALCECGASVVIVDNDAGACQERVDLLRRIAPDRVSSIVVDLKDTASLTDRVKNHVSEIGRLDVLVHCARYVGIDGWAAAFSEQTADAFIDAVRVDLAPILPLVSCCRNALAQHGRGSVILMGSIYGHVGPDFRMYEGASMSNPAGYAALKAGQVQLARYLSTTLAPEIRVNSISPGGVFRGQAQGFIDRYQLRTPMQRMAVEEDFKGAFIYLASDLSAYVTGQDILVDGGWTAW